MSELGVVARPRVLQRLSDAATHRILLIVAAAGCGKTIALDAYAATLGRGCVRFDVGPEHRTLDAFVRGLTDAFSPAHRICETVIVDGLQVVQDDAAITGFLLGLISRTKANVRWIIASRSTVGLPVGTWLAHGDCNLVIDAADLRLTIEEARDAARDLGFAVEDDQLAGVLEFTEGWPAATNVALRASMRSVDAPKLHGIVREASRRFWEEQVYPGVDAGERDVLAVAAVLPEIDVRILQSAGFADARRAIENVWSENRPHRGSFRQSLPLPSAALRRLSPPSNRTAAGARTPSRPRPSRSRARIAWKHRVRPRWLRRRRFASRRFAALGKCRLRPARTRPRRRRLARHRFVEGDNAPQQSANPGASRRTAVTRRKPGPCRSLPSSFPIPSPRRPRLSRFRKIAPRSTDSKLWKRCGRDLKSGCGRRVATRRNSSRSAFVDSNSARHIWARVRRKRSYGTCRETSRRNRPRFDACASPPASWRCSDVHSRSRPREANARAGGRLSERAKSPQYS